MIEANRPLCVMTSSYPYSDEFHDYGIWTLAEEPYSEAQLEWESCSACFAKEVPEEDRTFKDIDRAYVQCMEPALYYVLVGNGGLGGARLVFCEYHRPKVFENS